MPGASACLEFCGILFFGFVHWCPVFFVFVFCCFFLTLGSVRVTVVGGA